VGAAGQGQALRAKLHRELTEIRTKLQGRKAKSLVFIIGRNPGTVDGLVAAGRASYLSELMEVAGGRNAFADSIAPYPKITLEELFARNPEVIVDMGDMAATEKASEAERKAVIQLWSRYGTLRAVREGRVFVVADDIFVVPGPRMVEAAREFARMLHPEVFR
jgi:iron complex transport system substrate-binding protein